MAPDGRMCVDIDFDNDFFYLKYMNQNTTEGEDEFKRFYICKVAHKWRSRIKYNYTQPVKFDQWGAVAHSKFGEYFKIYTKYVNMSYLYLMAHRNYISVFDMSAGNGKGEWTSHFSISNKSYVRDIVIQRLHDP